ncbi:unnamed protein product [Sympodiomycopsis kandeliae]
MASSAASSIWARRFPNAHSRVTRFKATKTYSSASWFWKYKGSIAFGLSATYFFGGYYIEKLRAAERDRTKPNTYLVWKFYPGSIVETKGPPQLKYLLAQQAPGEDPPRAISLFDAVLALEVAAKDENIRGLYGDFSTLHWPSNVQPETLGLAQIEELITAIHRFKLAKMKQFPQDHTSITQSPEQEDDTSEDSLQAAQTHQHIPSTIAFADTFNSQSTYLLASAFEKVYIQPAGTLALTGISTSLPFFARLLKKVGIKISASARRDYKSMIAPATQDESLTKPQLQNQADLLGELNRSVAYTIGVNRFPNEDPEKAADRVMDIMSNGPYSAAEARDLGLVDDTLYKADVSKLIHGGEDVSFSRFQSKRESKSKKVKEAAKGKKEVHLQSLPHYSTVIQNSIENMHPDSVVQIAVCYLRGTISSAPAEDSASAVIRGLRQAAQDDKIKVIILRMDSGGGDVVASESVWQAVKRVRETSNKPVLVSFGNVAASGAYYAATAANLIMASENTITGSIGVASIRPTLTRKLFDHAGVAVQSFFTGAKGESLLYEADAEQSKRHEKYIDETYDDFLQKVMDGRGISPEKIEEVAGGRVFTGLRAWSQTGRKLSAAERRETHMQLLARDPELLADYIVKLTERALELPSSEFTERSSTVSRSQFSAPDGWDPSPLGEWEIRSVSEGGEFDAQRIVRKALKPEGVVDAVKREHKHQQSSSSSSDQEHGLVEQGFEVIDATVSALKESVDEVRSDPAEAAHQAALESRASDNGEAEDHAAAAAASVPYGRGLIDGIGGIWETTILAQKLTLDAEIREAMEKEGLSEAEAMTKIRSKAESSIDQNGQRLIGGAIRLKKYPTPKKFVERFEEFTTSSGKPTVSMMMNGLWMMTKEELSTIMAQAFVKVVHMVASDPQTTLTELSKKVQDRAAANNKGTRRTSMEYDGFQPRF